MSRKNKGSTKVGQRMHSESIKVGRYELSIVGRYGFKEAAVRQAAERNRLRGKLLGGHRCTPVNEAAELDACLKALED